jgi:hypothetical protein
MTFASRSGWRTRPSRRTSYPDTPPDQREGQGLNAAGSSRSLAKLMTKHTAHDAETLFAGLHPQCRLRLEAWDAFNVEICIPVERLANVPPQPPSASGAPFRQSSLPARLPQKAAPSQLWKAVLNARADLVHQRHQTQADPGARIALVNALQSYVDSLAERGHPVPYALRDELRLRLSCESSRYGRSTTRAS